MSMKWFKKLLCLLFGHKAFKPYVEHRMRYGDKKNPYMVEGVVYRCPRCGKKMTRFYSQRRKGTAKNWWY